MDDSLKKRGNNHEFPPQEHTTKRKKGGEPDNVLRYMPDASTLSFAVAHKKLTSILGQFNPQKQNVPNANTFAYALPMQEFPSQHVLFLLQTHPVLIGMEFYDKSVLSFLLQARAKPIFIKEWCRLYKAHTGSVSSSALRYHALLNPINEYCCFGGVDGVLRVLLEEFPDFLMKKEGHNIPFENLLFLLDDEVPDFPTTLVAAHDPSGHLILTLKTMLEFNPSMLVSCDWQRINYDLDPRNRSLSREAKQCLYENYAQRSGLETFNTEMMDVGWGDSDRDTKSEFGPVPANLSILKHLHFEVESWGVEASKQLVEALLSVSDPAFIDLSIPLRENCLDESTRKKLGETFQKSKTLKHLHLTCEGIPPEGSPNAVTDLCTHAIKSNQSIESLKLSFASATSTGLSCLLSNCCSLKSLTLYCPTILSNEWPTYISTSSCSLEQIKIELSEPEPKEVEWLKGFLSEMRNFCFLTKLDIISWDGTTEELCNLISEQLPVLLKVNRLRSFSTNCNLTIGTLSQAMSSNSLTELFAPILEGSLAMFADALEQDNMTLERTDIFFKRDSHSESNFPLASHPKGAKILYFTMLNRFGRAKLQNQGATLTDLVECLCTVENASERAGPDFPWTEEEAYELRRCRRDQQLGNAGEGHEKALKHSIQYGLLHQAPSLWT